jgi:hypothetical protein
MINKPSKKFNFPAFPVQPYPGDRENAPIKSNTGMSMRDYFASAALSGLSATEGDAKQIASLAYEIADAMLDRLTTN